MSQSPCCGELMSPGAVDAARDGARVDRPAVQRVAVVDGVAVRREAEGLLHVRPAVLRRGWSETPVGSVPRLPMLENSGSLCRRQPSPIGLMWRDEVARAGVVGRRLVRVARATDHDRVGHEAAAGLEQRTAVHERVAQIAEALVRVQRKEHAAVAGDRRVGQLEDRARVGVDRGLGVEDATIARSCCPSSGCVRYA